MAGPVVVGLLILQVALLAIAQDAEAATTRALTITTGSAHPTVAFGAFDGNPTKLFDFNGDGSLEIIAQNDNQYAYVFNSQNGALLAQIKTTFPSGWGARTMNGPEAYRDGNVSHLVLSNSAAYVTSYRFDEAGSSATNFKFVKEWERRTTDCFASPGADSKPTLADLDRDGHLEIIQTTEESGIVALRANGGLYWKKCIGGGNAEATVGDLNLDGWPDVVFGSDGGIVTAMNGRTGSTMWSFNLLSRFNLSSGSMPTGVSIGQVDGVGGLDVVAGARDSHNATDWSQDHALLVAISSGGALLWGKQDPTGNPLTYTRPIIADAAGDGENEVYWGDWNTNGHKPPFVEADAWNVTGPGNFYRYDKFGNLVWKQSLSSFWSNKDLALADVDGDGVQEILANGPGTNGHDGIWYLNSATGAKETFVDTYPWMVTRAPVVADLAGDGGMQWIVQTGPMATNQGPAILVFETGVPYSAVWPHLADPQPGTPAPPPPPPAGTFNSTFTIKSPNAWWQEVTATPTPARTIANVEVRFPGSDWQAMTKASWGAWTSSYNTPGGTSVEFLATDPAGFISQSAPFTWMDGTLTKGSVPPTNGTPPPDPDFTATFQPTTNVNEWWVEVAIQANAPLSAVEVKVGNGAYRPLDATSWGTWAKSYNVPSGSQVVFKATSSGGATVTSSTFTWMGGTPPPPGGFNASFTPVAVGNDWWVEVRVTSTGTVAKVEANFNNGTWQVIDKQSWGNWAKSIFTPNGTVVRFRATDDAGLTVTSGPTTWT